jgi:RNA polymerase sigma-70 factor, ECF subfamily
VNGNKIAPAVIYLNWHMMIDQRLPTAKTCFEAVILPHLDAAYNLARWLTRNTADADDVVQEAALRAVTYFSGFRGTNPRAWLLQIVRNVAYASKNLVRGAVLVGLPDEGKDSFMPELADPGDDPETTLVRREEIRHVTRLLAALPAELREALVLREIEELSYKEIAQITETPIGTVMSRLWRGRQLLAAAVKAEQR